MQRASAQHEKVRAIHQAPEPKNATELRSFLGLLNYYAKFLPNLSSRLSPLYLLLNKCQPWSWGTEQQQAFKAAKEALEADTLLVHYDPSKPLVIACDASKHGIGAVLSHVQEDGSDRPVAYVSRTLSVAERNYSQLEHEALAIVFAVKKFHYYLFGRSFSIESDHRPLMFLFGEKNGIPQMASSRIQRWALTLSAYSYQIRYRAGKYLSHADALSRLPCPNAPSHDGLTGDSVMLLNHLDSTSVSAIDIKNWTTQDPTLSCVRRFVETGWPDNAEELDKEFHPYFSKSSAC